MQRLDRLTTSDRSPAAPAGDLTGSGIVHLDGRWGAGKTTLVELMLREPAVRGRLLVVRYDAWRQAAIAPEWWSVASELRRAVHAQRALPTRALMTVGGFVHRISRSTSTWAALVVVALGGLGATLLRSRDASPVAHLNDAVALATGVAAVLGLVLVVTRSLFWSAPLIARLQARTDDNPLGEISGIVAHLRRWSPRQGAAQGLADWLLFGWLTLTLSMALWWRPALDAWAGTPDRLRAALLRTVVALACLAVALALAHARRPSRSSPDGAPRPSGSSWLHDPAGGVHAVLRRRPFRAAPEWWAPLTAAQKRAGVGAAALAAVALWLAAPLAAQAVARVDTAVGSATVLWTAAAALGAVAYAGYLVACRGLPRRMVLLVVDDLDRCEAPRVVRLLETVHTVLRDRCAPRRLQRWRSPAPLGVLVLASGAWIRDAFRTQYSDFDRTTREDAVRDLGADFLQKVFDHSVLVPDLSGEQTEDLIHVVARTRHRLAASRPPRLLARGGGQPAEPRDAEVGGAGREREWSGDRGHPVGSVPRPASGVDGVADSVGRADGERPAGTWPPAPSAPRDSPRPDAAEATDPGGGSSSPASHEATTQARADADSQRAREDLGANAQFLVEHLLTRYSSILPGNPRLIIRVASTWAMLRAVGRSLNVEVDSEAAQELLARAAVIYVRFPLLVDALLDSDHPPVTDPQDRACSPAWRRRDVQEVLTLNGGQRLDVEDLALCFGKAFAPAVPGTPGVGSLLSSPRSPAPPARHTPAT